MYVLFEYPQNDIAQTVAKMVNQKDKAVSYISHKKPKPYPFQKLV